MNAGNPGRAAADRDLAPGAIVRAARQAQKLTLTQLGALTGYSAAQVSRYERGIAPLTDIAVLRRFADALGIPHNVFGLTPDPPGRHHRHPSGQRADTPACRGLE